MFWKSKKTEESGPKQGDIKVIETKKGRRVTMMSTGKKGFGAWKGCTKCIAPKNH